MNKSIRIGSMIIFNSLLAKNRKAFCINYNETYQIIYRGFFGLKCVDQKTFLGFARIIKKYDYAERELTRSEKVNLIIAYINLTINNFKTVDEYVKALYKEADIAIYLNQEVI